VFVPSSVELNQLSSFWYGKVWFQASLKLVIKFALKVMITLVTKTVCLEMQQEKTVCEICGNQPSVTCSQLSLTLWQRSNAIYFWVQYSLNG